MDNIITISIVGILLVFSAFFSASETAFSSINKIKLKNMASQGNKKAKQVLDLTERYDTLLSTVLIGNNIVNIASSALCTVFFIGIFGSSGLSIATILMTVAVLLFGEITPKTIAKEIPEQYAIATVQILKLIIILLTPFNKLASLWQMFIIHIFHVKKMNTITEAELLTFVQEARQDGSINEREETLIRRTIAFDDITAGTICTPRIDVVAAELHESVESIEEKFRINGFSRLPVYEKTIDRIQGIILLSDFMWNKNILAIIKPAVCVIASIKITRLLSIFQERQAQFAIVVDEFGGTVGIITVEDIIEELVGEIWDERDSVYESITQLNDHTYRVNGQFSFTKMLEYFGLESEQKHSTVANWIMEQAGRLPKEGEQYAFKNLMLTVSAMHRHRVSDVTVQRNTHWKS
ncbi:MAG: hemolysin family protein [Treponema sp.]|jgi:CBS domain containing-hemolysin-like protein|nr:hemolysin family protein [Treponema sp.]